MFTLRRSGCSRWTDLGVHHGPKPAVVGGRARHLTLEARRNAKSPRSQTEVPDPRKWGRMGTRNSSRGPSSAVWRREFSAKYAENRAGEAMNPLPLPVAESPRVSLAAAAVQARRGPARPEPGEQLPKLRAGCSSHPGGTMFPLTYSETPGVAVVVRWSDAETREIRGCGYRIFNSAVGAIRNRARRWYLSWERSTTRARWSASSARGRAD
jgi:hypothetical protein